MSIVRDSWFFEITKTALKDGVRLRNGDKPNQATFQNLVDSKISKAESTDRAKEDTGTFNQDVVGHVTLATDEQAKSNESKKPDRSLVVQPSQLPVSASGSNVQLSFDGDTYSGEFVSVDVDDSVSSYNKFLLGATTGLIDFFNNVFAKIEELIGIVSDHASSINSLNQRVTQNTSDISELSSGGEVSSVPIGSVMSWLKGSGVPEGYLVLEGNEVSKTEYNLLYDILGDQYNDGSELSGNFRLPDASGKVLRNINPSGSEIVGGNLGSDSVIISKDNLPAHGHRIAAFNTESDGAHEHDVEYPVRGLSSGGTNGIGFNSADYQNSDGLLFAKSTERSKHSHRISDKDTSNRNIGNVPFSNDPMSIIPNSLIVSFIIRAK